MKKLILHCGLHKTGSSSIQTTLYSNKDLLCDNGIYYPKVTIEESINHSVPMHVLFSENPFSHHIIRRRFEGDKNQFDEYKHNIMKVFSEELALHKSMNLLISGEDISLLKQNELQKMRVFFEEKANVENFEVIIYVRNPLSWSVSNSQELIKHGLYTFQQVLGLKYQQNIKNRLHEVIKVFGSENIEVVSFDSIINQEKDVVIDLLARIGISDSSIQTKRINETISLEKALTFNAAKFLDTENRVEYIGYLNNKVSNQGSPLIFPDFFLDRINNESEEDIAYLKDSFSIELNSKLESKKILVNYDLLKKNLNFLKHYLEDIYKKTFGFVEILRDLSISIQGYSSTLSAQLMAQAFNERNGPAITEHLKQHLKNKNIFGFFNGNKFITIETEKNTTRNWPINFNSFLNDPIGYFSKHKVRMDYDLYRDDKTLFLPQKILASVLYEGVLRFPSPFSGRLYESSTILGPNIFKFHDSEHKENFYITFSSELNSHSSISVFNIIIPSMNFILHIDFDDQSKFYQTSLSNGALLESIYKYTIKQDAEDIKVSATPKPTVLSTRSLFHIGHALWNSLSVYDDLVSLDSIRNNSIRLAVSDNFYLSAKETSSLFDLKYSEYFINDNELLKFSYVDGIIPVFLSNDYITSNLANKLTNRLLRGFSFERNEAFGKKVIILSIRSGDRSCNNQAQLYSALIKILTNKYSNLVFAIDGVNDLSKISNSNAAAVNRIIATIDDEKAVAEEIIKMAPVNENIFSLIGKPIEESLYWVQQSLAIASPWGAAMVKYRWLIEKSVFVFGSEFVMSDRHLHKTLYEDPRFKELNPNIKCAYYSGSSISETANRNSHYTIDQETFISEAFNFFDRVLNSEF